MSQVDRAHMVRFLFPLQVTQKILATVQWDDAVRVSKAFRTALELQFHTCKKVWSQKRDIESVGDYPCFWRWVVFEAEDSLLLPLWGPTLINELKRLHYDETLKHINSIAELDVLHRGNAADAKLYNPCVLSKAALDGQMVDVIRVLASEDYQTNKEYQVSYDNSWYTERCCEEVAMGYGFEVGWVHWVKVCLECGCRWDAEHFMPSGFEYGSFDLSSTDFTYVRHPLRWRCFLLLATRLDLCVDFEYLCRLMCALEALRVDFTWPKSLILALEERRYEYATLQRFLKTANVQGKQVGSVPVL